MAWTAPETAIPGVGVTSSFLNQYLRDNQLEFAAAKASFAGQILVTAGKNSVSMQQPQTHLRNNQETTTSETPVALNFPTVTANHNGSLLCIWSAAIRVSSGPANIVSCGPEIVGSVLPGQTASIVRAMRYSGTGYSRFSCHTLYYEVDTDFNGVRLMHWVSDNATTGMFANRYLCVIPL